MSHGFPGYTTNNDLELALMRAGCVVIHMNHRGAWGSEGNYLFTNLKDDLVAITKWAYNRAIADQYGIDPDNIFLVGHSMGGQSVLNAAKELPFIRGVAALAAYDIGAAFRYKMEKGLFLMIETIACLTAQAYPASGFTICGIASPADGPLLSLRDISPARGGISFATMALQNGVDVKTISNILGHFSAGFTLDAYAHVTTNMQQDAANKVGDFLRGKS